MQSIWLKKSFILSFYLIWYLQIFFSLTEPHVADTLQTRALLVDPIPLYFAPCGSSCNVRGGAEQLL